MQIALVCLLNRRKMKYHLIYLLLIFYQIVSAQNLLKNPGFEEYIKCPDGESPRGNWNGYVKDWGSINHTTYSNPSSPGYYFRVDCFTKFEFDSLYWFVQKDSIMPLEGQAMAQIILTSSKTKREFKKYTYYYVKLTEPLKKDSTYAVSYYIHWNRFGEITDHFGVTFIKDTSEIYEQNGYQYLTHDYVGIRDTFLGPDLLWHKVEGCYTAKGGEEWLILGEFIPKEEINVHPWKPLVGLGQNAGGSYVVMMDNFYIGKTTLSQEEDHILALCDGEKIKLPEPENENSIITDIHGNQIDEVTVSWPDHYNYFYEDLCYGKIGNIEIITEICIEKADTNIILCEEQTIDLQNLLQNEFEIINDQGEILKEFSSPKNGRYYFTARHKRYGNWGDIVIEVVKCEDCKMLVPNIIKRNSSDNNNLWKIKSLCSFEDYNAKIYDRWGNKVFESENPEDIWDGSYYGKPCLPGVYIYCIKHKFLHPVIAGTSDIMCGDITIIE
jgi:gliding motility-associated-like protein